MRTRMDELISKYKNNFKKIQELNVIINQYTITKNDVIMGKMFSSPDGERVQTSNVTDKTAAIAMTADELVEKYNEELALERATYEIEKRRLEKENVLFETALNALDDNIRDFAKDLVRGMKWDDLELKYHVSRATIGNWRKQVVCELETQYNKVEQELMRQLMR